MNARAKPKHEPILSARGIVNRFGKQDVHNKLNLDVSPGEILGIAGGSGSGKSVLLKTLVGLRRPDRGKVKLEGKPIDARSNALVVIVASLARFIWVGIFRQPMAGRRRERPDLPFPFSPPH